MRIFQNASIRHKQQVVIMLTSSVVLLLACAAFVTYDTVTFRRKLVESVSVLADVIASNCAAAIDYNDPKSAGETLAALQANHNIVFACIYARDGSIFATYRPDFGGAFTPPAVEIDARRFTGNHLYLFRPVIQRNEMTGSIFVASDLKYLSDRLLRYLGIGGAVFLAASGLAFMLSSRLLRLVTDPILRLAGVARSVALDKNYSVRATKRTNDELGELVDGFNEMLAQIQARDTALQTARDDREKRAEERTRELEIIHQQLVHASHRSGMAEIATNVLHNVGNVLNSVNVSTGLIVEGVKKFQVSNLARVVALLHENAADLGEFITKDSRGKHLPAYLAELSGRFTSDQEAIVSEGDLLRRNVEHIREIVAMQQDYATFGRVKEMMEVVDLVEDSLRMSEGALIRHNVEVIREFTPVPALNVEKHKMLQILVNLLRNAKDACIDSGRHDKRIVLRVAGDGEHVRISVADNGVGILAENLTRIFNHGFTTKTDGHGFGLHSGAVAAKEVGGSLIVHSAGLGHGATFILELPYNSDTPVP